MSPDRSRPEGPVARHVDSALGRWTHTAWRPPHLSGVVDELWHFEGTMRFPRERGFPDGRLELIVHLGPCFRGLAPDGGVETYAPVCLAGLQTRASVIEAPPGACCVLGVRLAPAGAYAVLGPAAVEARGRTVDGADVAGAAAGELAARCHDAPTPDARLRQAAAWVAARLARAATPPDPAVAWAAAVLAATHGAATIEALHARTGRTRAGFAARFAAQVGVAPKRYARVLRFHRALGLLHGSDAPLADVALGAGYCDQPHMHADFREFAGLTPAALRRARAYPGSPSLAEGEAAG